MALHAKQHGLIDPDHHFSGTVAPVGEINLVGTDELGNIVEIGAGPIDSVSNSNIIRRTNTGHIKIPIAGQNSDEAISKKQIDDLTTTDIQDSIDKRYITDLEKLQLSKLSNDYKETFIIDDWVHITNYYYKDINHLLNSSDLIVRIMENREEVWIDHWDIISDDSIRLFVCDIPDGRFDGKCLIHKLII